MYARQRQTTLFLFLMLMIGCLSAETVYRTVDEHGKVIFTDKPSEDAEEIKIKDLETINNPNPAKYKRNSKLPDEDENPYKNLVVTSPENGAGIRSNIGNVNISLDLEPELQRGHKVIISMDGNQVGTGMSVSLQNVDRGTHSVSASVVDTNGKKLISTSSTFSMLRATQ